MASDSAGNVYILLHGSVYAYHPKGVKPRNSFALLGGDSYYTIAATTRYVYVQNYATHAIEVYDANGTGSPLPVSTFTTYDEGDLSVGP